MHFTEYMGLHEKQIQLIKASTSQPRPIILYGGGGGGGKSYGLRAALVHLNLLYSKLGFHGQRTMLACADYPRLRDRHFGKFSEEYRQFGVVKESQTHGLGFHFKNENYGVIAFRNLAQPDNFRGTECSGIGVDEATELQESIQGLDILTTLQYPIRSSKGVPYGPLMMGSNPDGIGHSWVKGLFVTKLRIPENDDPSRYIFIRALPHDNPSLPQEWIDVLNTYPEHIRKARLEGDWSAPEGARWKQLSEHVHSFSAKEKWPHGVPQTGFTIIGEDWGLRAPFCALWIYVEPETGDLYVYRCHYKAGLTYDDQAKSIIHATGLNEDVRVLRMDPAMWQRPKDPETGLIKPSAAEQQIKIFRSAGWNCPIEKGYNHSRIQGQIGIDMVLNRANGFPNLYIDKKECEPLWSEIEGAVFDTRATMLASEDIDPRLPDHAITALIYAIFAQIYPDSVPVDTMPTAEEVDDWTAKRLLGLDQPEEEYDYYSSPILNI